MMSEFRHPVGNTVHRVVLFFKYTPDETALRIFGIGYTALLTDDPDWKPPVDNA
jgi:hypothetical protein